MGVLLLHQRMSHPNSSTSPSQEPPDHHELWLHRWQLQYTTTTTSHRHYSSDDAVRCCLYWLKRIDHHHELWLHSGDTVYDVHQETIVLTLSFSASIESVMTCNSTQDFLYVWNSIDSRLIGESRLNQVMLSSLSTYWYLHLLITSFLSINFIIIIMKVTDTG
jgi:hypothetical protein